MIQNDSRGSSSRSGARCRPNAGIGAAVALLLLFLAPTQAHAALDAESQFVLNSFSFLVWGALVMWMCAGFTMLESGSVRTKNASVICLKNIGLYSIAGLAFYFLGYNIMYVGVGEGGWFGTLTFLYGTTGDEIALLGGDEAAGAAVIENGYSTMSDWFFQMVFVATTASIVSGTLAERVKLWSFFVFIAVLTAIIYPVIGSWTWGGGWLSAMGFQDFAGSTIVHSTGGWAALAGAIVVGARRGKFRKDGSVRSTPPSNVPGATYTFTARMFLSALVQYNSAVDQMGTNVRFRWEYSPGSELFVVYNDQRDTTLRPGRLPLLENRAFIVKLTRLLRF